MRMNSPANYITLDRAGRRVGRRSRWARLTFQTADCGYVAGLLEQWKRDRSLCVVITCKVGQMVRFGSLKRTASKRSLDSSSTHPFHVVSSSPSIQGFRSEPLRFLLGRLQSFWEIVWPLLYVVFPLSTFILIVSSGLPAFWTPDWLVCAGWTVFSFMSERIHEQWQFLYEPFGCTQPKVL